MIDENQGDYAKNSTASEFIICTEEGVEHKLVSDSKSKRFYFPEPRPCCTDMKRNTLSSLLSVLQNEDKEVQVGEDICRRAMIPLDRMLELAK